MGRAPCCDKANVKRGPWSPEEDAKLKSYIEQHGTGGNWIALPQKIGLKRCGKSCRLRWLNYLRPNIRHGGFSEEEDNIICSLYVSIGSRWSVIAAQLPGRTDNDIKNYWNTRLKKKLLGKQQEEVRNYKQKQAESSVGTTSHLHPYSMPTVFSNHSSSIHQQHPSFNDQDSLRTLLLKLGGRFSHSDSDHLYRPSLQDIPVMGTDDGQLIIPQQLPQQIYQELQQLNNNITAHGASSSSSSSSSGCIISTTTTNNNIINGIIDHHDGNQVEMGLDGAVDDLLYGDDEDIMVNIEKMMMIGIGGPPTSRNWCSDSSITTSIYPHQQQCAFQHHFSYNNGA